MTIHPTPHPSAGETVQTRHGDTYAIEDYYDRVTGKSWMFAAGNPAAMIYAVRSAEESLPLDDEVLYGHIGGLGHIYHVSELDLPQQQTEAMAA